MYHYTYLIQHKTSPMRYIGKRSCRCKPENDINYWGSSKHLPKDIQTDHVKITLKEHNTAKDAISHEILLHKLNDVARNSDFYNKACQTATGFDTTGTKLKFTDEHKRKISKSLTGITKTLAACKNNSIAQKALYAKGYVNPRTNIKMSDELKQKISSIHKTKGTFKGTKNPKFKPWFISYSAYTKLFYDVTKEEQAVSDGHSKTYY